MMQNKTIIIVDDNTAFCNSTEWWLKGAGYNVQSFSCPTLALSRLSEQLGDQNAKQDTAQQVCILMDVRMPKMSGLDLHDALQAQGLYLPVIYMTGHGAVTLAVEAMRKGAVTFLEKPFDDVTLQSALELAFSAEFSALQVNNNKDEAIKSVVTPDTVLLDSGEVAYQQRYAKLTPREREVLQYVVGGKANKEIARYLAISVKTVEAHRARAIKKLAAKKLQDVMRMVITGRVQ